MDEFQHIQLLPKQNKYWHAIFKPGSYELSDNPYTEFAYFGGFGSGKSMINYLVAHTICIGYKNMHGIFIRLTYPELRDSVIPQFHDKFQKYREYTYNKSERTVYYKNGSRLDFRAFDKDAKVLSNMYNFACFSQAEEIPKELYLQLLGRTRLRDNNPLLRKNPIFLEGNPANGWCRERYKENPLSKKTFFIESTTFDNPYLPPDYVERLIENYPEGWIRRYVYGEWENFDEMVFSEFRESVHVIDPFIPHIFFKRVCGMDYGYKNPSAILWGAIDYDDNIYIWDEFYEAGKEPNILALEANRYGKIVTAIDPSTKAPDRDGKSVFDDLLNYGVLLIEAHKDKLRNITNVNMLFKKKQLFITRNCVNLIKEIRNYKWKRLKLGEERNLPEEVIKKDDHACDALMYLIASLEDLTSEAPEKKKEKDTLQYKTIQREHLKVSDLG